MNVLVAIRENVDPQLDELRVERDKLVERLQANLDETARLELAKLVSQKRAPEARTAEPEGGKS